MANGYAGEKAPLQSRLKRIEGQVRGIAGMIADDRYCVDILIQVQAARAALARVEADVLSAHVRHCVEAAVKSGNPDEQAAKLGELMDLLPRMTRD